MIDGKTLVIDSNNLNEETVKSIHEKIYSKTYIPINQQRLIYNGKHLRSDHSLAHYNILTNCFLQFSIKVQSIIFPKFSGFLDNLLRFVRLLISTPLRDDVLHYPGLNLLLASFVNMVPQCIHLATVLFKMFLTSGVPEALVMLYMSPNKQRVNVSVKHFINVCKDGLLSPVYHEMLAPVVLHFCVLLRQVLVTHVDDDLHVFFRTTLGSMLSDYAWFSTSTSKIALYDIFPFVDELAYKLSNDLVESVNSVIGPSETEVHDFKAFVWFLLAALVDPMAFETLIPVHYHHNHPWYNT
nr:hypothetical protein [Tanacetum cinerariifolium]